MYLSLLDKTAGNPEVSYGLRGRLYLSESGWLMLAVPNSIVRGCFDALHEQGVELPLDSDGKLNAHISVMRPEELESLGGGDKITERGQAFSYTLGKLQIVEPSGWREYSRVWFIEVKSPELERLRKSYGLPRVPNDGQHEFHITVARRKKNVLRANAVRKAAEVLRKLKPNYTGASVN